MLAALYLPELHYGLHPGIDIVDCKFHPTRLSPQTINIMGCNFEKSPWGSFLGIFHAINSEQLDK